jgi:hypothetical protein
MKVFRMAAVLALLAGPAYAQMPNINLLQEGPGKTEDEKAADAERDKAYKETLKKIPDAKVSNDPWGAMRSDTPKAAAPKGSEKGSDKGSDKAPAKASASASPKKPKTGANAAN